MQATCTEYVQFSEFISVTGAIQVRSNIDKKCVRSIGAAGQTGPQISTALKALSIQRAINLSRQANSMHTMNHLYQDLLLQQKTRRKRYKQTTAVGTVQPACGCSRRYCCWPHLFQPSKQNKHDKDNDKRKQRRKAKVQQTYRQLISQLRVTRVTANSAQTRMIL